MDEHQAMQISLSNPSSENSDQLPPPYNTFAGGSSSQPQHPHFNIPPPKKPRGRPPGSKNKPKPPLYIAHDNDQAMKPLVIEVSSGTDVLEAVIQYGLRRRTGISILTGSGTISKATLCYPLSTSPAFTLHGPFSLLTLSGTFMYPPSPPPPPPPHSSSSSSLNPNLQDDCNTFGITLSGVQGQIFGGIIGGKVVAGGDRGVKVMCSMFKNPELHRAGGVNDVGEEGDDYDDDDDGDDDGDDDEGDNPNVGGEGGVGSSFGGVGGSESLSGFNPTPLNLAPSDPSFMPWTHPRPPNY